MTKALNLSHFVGSALVVKNDHVIYNRAFGYANKAKNQRNKVNSKYQIFIDSKVNDGGWHYAVGAGGES